MKIILHLGAQRTATTTLQHYMRLHSKALAAEGVGFWGPMRTRHSRLFSGLFVSGDDQVRDEHIALARARVNRALDATARLDVKALIISDENMLGSARGNLQSEALYGMAAHRLRAFGEVFDGRIDRVMLGTRRLDEYWASTMAYAVKRGASLPGNRKLEAVAKGTRSWRDVIEDIAAVFDTSELEVHQHEAFASYPDLRIAQAAGCGALPVNQPNLWLNQAPDIEELRGILTKGKAKGLPEGTGRYQPFDATQRAALKEKFADDMFWLAAQGSKLATYVENNLLEETGKSLSPATERGHDYDQARGMGRAR